MDQDGVTVLAGVVRGAMLGQAACELGRAANRSVALRVVDEEDDD